MSSIREKLSSVVFLWIGFGLVLVTMVFIAAPAIEVEFEGVVNSAAIFWRRVPVWVGNWPMFVGYMSILVGGILMGSMALSFVQPSALTEKIILLVAGGLLLLGVILVFCFKETFFAVNGWESVRDVYWGPYVAASIATLALACDGVALALDW
jgi:hypothetical protein